MKRYIFSLLVLLFAAGALDAHAKKNCSDGVEGTYGYQYTGVATGQTGLAEVGWFTVNGDSVSGEGRLVFAFPDFGGNGPLWLVINETQDDGTIQRGDKCSGTLSFYATAVVTDTSDATLVPVGYVLFYRKARTVDYTGSMNGLRLDLVSTAVNQADLSTTPPTPEGGTLATGVAHRQ